MNKIISGSLYRDDYIDVVDLQGSGLVKQEVRPRKNIVGISMTHPKEDFLRSHLVFPTIIDTGLNKSFDIDERHLYFWNATPKAVFPFLRRKDRSASRKISNDIREAKIWLHLEPYGGPRFKGGRGPRLLYNSDQIRIMDGVAAEPEPRFPLLGIEALIENQSLLFVDGRSSTFEIHEWFGGNGFQGGGRSNPGSTIRIASRPSKNSRDPCPLDAPARLV